MNAGLLQAGVLDHKDSLALHTSNAAAAAWRSRSCSDKCCLQLEDEDQEHFWRLRQLAKDGLVLIADGHVFVPTDGGLEVRSHGVWALVPQIDMLNRPYLTVSEASHQPSAVPKS